MPYDNNTRGPLSKADIRFFFFRLMNNDDYCLFNIVKLRTSLTLLENEKKSTI